MSLIIKVLVVFSFIAALNSAPLEDQSISSTTIPNRLSQPGATSSSNPPSVVSTGVQYSSSSAPAPVPTSDSTKRAVRHAQNPTSTNTPQNSSPNPVIKGTKPPINTSQGTGPSRQVRETVAQAALNTQTPTSAPLTTEASRKTRDTTGGSNLNVQSNTVKPQIPSAYSTLPTQQDQKQRNVRDTPSTTPSSPNGPLGQKAHLRPAPRPLDPSKVNQRQRRDTQTQKTPTTGSSAPQVPPVNDKQKPILNSQSVSQRPTRDAQKQPPAVPGIANKPAVGTTSAPKNRQHQPPSSLAGRTLRDADQHKQHPHDQHVASNVHPIPTPTSQKKINGNSRPQPVHRPEREAPAQNGPQTEKVQTSPAPVPTGGKIN